MATPAIKDVDWVRKAFLLPSHAIQAADARRDLFRSASFKFTDTTLGGNFAINPPPQFTRHADLKVKGMHSASKGMGRYYSEAIDDNSFVIHMGFGVPSFTSLTTFFNEFYDPQASSLARTGRARGLAYTLGRAAGFVVTAPLLPVIMAGRAIRFVFNQPSSKYYSLKPTMPLYWKAVNTIANSIAVNMGIVPRMFDRSEELGNAASPEYTSDDIALYHKMLPERYRETGGIAYLDARATAIASSSVSRSSSSRISVSQPELRQRPSGSAGSACAAARSIGVDSKGVAGTHYC